MNGQKIALWKHVRNLKNIAKQIEHFDSNLQSIFPMLGEPLGGINPHGDRISVVASCPCKVLDELETANCIRKKLTLAR